MRRRQRDERVQTPLGAGVAVLQRAVFERFSSAADPDRPQQELAQPRGRGGIAAVDGVLDVAQHMGEADLMRLGQVLVAGVAVGDPDAGPMTALHVLGDGLPARGRDLVQHHLGRDEHPLPVGGTIDAGGGLVGRDHPRRPRKLKIPRNANLVNCYVIQTKNTLEVVKHFSKLREVA